MVEAIPYPQAAQEQVPQQQQMMVHEEEEKKQEVGGTGSLLCWGLKHNVHKEKHQGGAQKQGFHD